MSNPLLNYLEQIPDFRRAEGKRYELAPLLLMIIMAIMSRCHGYREIATFLSANATELCKQLHLNWRTMPSHVTIRTVLMHLDVEALIAAFEKWARQHVQLKRGDVLACDGKALASTVSNHDNALQDFVSLVSIFTQRQGAVVAVASYHNGQSSEVPTLRHLLQTVDHTGVTYTMDALHAQKKRFSRSLTPATSTSSR